MTTLSTTTTTTNATGSNENNHLVVVMNDTIMTGNNNIDDKVDDVAVAMNGTNDNNDSSDNNDSNNNNDICRNTRNNINASSSTISTTVPTEVLIIENRNDMHEVGDADNDSSTNGGPMIEPQLQLQELELELELQEQEEKIQENSKKIYLFNLHPIIERFDWDLFYECLLMMQEYYTETEIHETFVLNTNKSASSVLHVACTYKVPYVLTLFILNIITSSIDDNNDDTAIERYLLVGDCDGNTPLHFACGNLFVDETIGGAADFSIIRTIANLGPQALITINKNGDTPFHMLLASTCFQQPQSSIIDTTPNYNSIAIEMSNEEILSSLLEILMTHMNHSNNTTTTSIDSIGMIPNENGSTLLHIAVGNRCHERVLMKLVELAPQAARMKDHSGMIPLHYVAMNVGLAPPTFVQQLLLAYPQCLYCQTYTMGDTPFHLLMKYARPYMTQKGIKFMDRSSIKLTELLLLGEGCNDSSNTTTATTTASTAENCNIDKDSMVVSPILIKNWNNYTPLHYCALYDTPTQLLRIILDKVPPAILNTALCITTTTTTEDDDGTTTGGSTPLHILMASTKVHESYDNIRLLLKSSSNNSDYIDNACRLYDANGYIPLMIAVQNKKCTSAVVKMLLKDAPDTVKMKHLSTGMRPIHIAVRNRKIHKSVIKELIKAYPISVQIRSNDGNTPLHEASKYCTSQSVIEILIRQYPDALGQRNLNGQLPFDLAQQQQQLQEQQLSSSHHHNYNDKILHLLDSNTCKKRSVGTVDDISDRQLSSTFRRQDKLGTSSPNKPSTRSGPPDQGRPDSIQFLRDKNINNISNGSSDAGGENLKQQQHTASPSRASKTHHYLTTIFHRNKSKKTDSDELVKYEI